MPAAFAVVVLVVWLSLSPAYAYLGGFEADDGYATSGEGFTVPNPGGQNGGYSWAVEWYNSGAFGANAGGGAYAIGQNTGRWTSPIGGSDDNRGYATKHKYTSVSAFDWLGDDEGHFLGVTGAGAGTGVTEYEYTFDSFDLSGADPTTLTEGHFTFRIYFCPGSAGSGVDAATDSPYGRLSFLDEAGNTVAQFGTGRTWFAGTSGFTDPAMAVWTRTGSDPAMTLSVGSGQRVIREQGRLVDLADHFPPCHRPVRIPCPPG
ncbi:MAG: hypothetical protein R3F11_30095 [Verrucomicrobiales bacterium]